MTRRTGVAKSLAALTAVLGLFLMLPIHAGAVLMAIDEIIFEQDGSVDPLVLAGTADLSVSGNVLTIVLRNTSTGVTGGAAATNLLTGLAFNLPAGVTIANSGATNAVAITGASTPINFSVPIPDSEWGAANGALSAINNLTLGGDVNASLSTLQAQVDFDLDGNSPRVAGPSFGMLSAADPSGTAGGQKAVQDSLTFTLLLDGTVPANLLALIDSSWLVLSFGSPNQSGQSVPEPSTVLLAVATLVGLGYCSIRRRRPQR